MKKILKQPVWLLTICMVVVVVFSYLGFSVIIIFECLILDVFYDIIKVTQISVHHRKAFFP